MSNIYKYGSTSEALTELRKEGFTYDFNLNPEDISQQPENYTIVELYQYEGSSGAGYRSSVYVIENKFGLKGVFVTGSSPNSEDKNAVAISKLCIKKANKPYM